jgi:hypothetical protein
MDRGQIYWRQLKRAKKQIDVVGGEMGIFKKRQNREVEDNAYNKEKSTAKRRSICMNEPAGAVVHGDRQEHKQYIYPLSPCIKEQAGSQE